MSKATDAIKRGIVRKKQLILYLLFGLLTLVCSLLAWYLTLRFGVLLLGDENGDPTAILDVLGSTAQWIVGIVVTFTTNKKWVFREAEHGARAATKQFGIFCSSRVLTYFLEVGVNLGMIALLDDVIGYYEPVVEVFAPGKEKVTYVKMTAEKAEKVLKEHIKGGKVVEEYTIATAKNL